jgi:hypothetical protein
LRSHTILKPSSVRSAIDVLNQRRLRRDHVGEAPGRDADRVAAELVAHPRAPALRPSRRSPEQSRLHRADRRRPTTRRLADVDARQARRALETARPREIWTPGQIAPPRYSPFALIASSVVAVPKSTTIIGGGPARLPNFSYAATALTMRSAPTSAGFS